MYSKYPNPMHRNYKYPRNNSNDDRLLGGGFLGPFILGGITGGLAAPLFYGGGYGYQRPYYNNYYYYPYPVYNYGYYR